MCIACTPIMNLSEFGSGISMSRRHLLRSGAAAAVGAGFICQPMGGTPRAFAAETNVVSRETLFFGGAIHTMNDARPSAEAILVRDGKIVVAGSKQEAESQITSGDKATVVDLDGRTMLPGFFDPHSHVVGVGLQVISANLLPAPDGGGTDIAAIQSILKSWMVENKGLMDRYGLIIGFGYDDSQLADKRHPTRHELDAVSGDLPVIIVHQSAHFGVANSKALETLKITAEMADPPGGVFRREADGKTPDGVMEENAFFFVIGKLMARFDAEMFLKMIKSGTEFCASFGYTTVQEARATLPTAAMLSKAAEKGLLATDVIVLPDAIEAIDAIKPSVGYTNRLRVGGAKLTIDGSPQGKTAWLTKPYFVTPEGKGATYAGYAAITHEQTAMAIDSAFENNWQIAVHANGDAAIDELIRCVRDATVKHGKADRRTVLIHGQACRLDQLDQLKELGIIPSFFPMHTFYWGDWHRDSVLGPERAEHISPCASALARGMIFTTHHDAPVANPDSMRVLSATVTRRTRSGDILGPRECVSVADALKAMTIWAAYQHFEEDRKGSIEVGKLADLVILDRDPMAVDPLGLADIKVLETIKEGTTVYTRT